MIWISGKILNLFKGQDNRLTYLTKLDFVSAATWSVDNNPQNRWTYRYIMTFEYKNIAFHHIILCIYNPQQIYLSRFPLRISHLEFYIYRTIWNWISSIQVAYKVLVYLFVLVFYSFFYKYYDKFYHNSLITLQNL